MSVGIREMVRVEEWRSDLKNVRFARNHMPFELMGECPSIRTTQESVVTLLRNKNVSSEGHASRRIKTRAGKKRRGRKPGKGRIRSRSNELSAQLLSPGTSAKWIASIDAFTRSTHPSFEEGCQGRTAAIRPAGTRLAGERR